MFLILYHMENICLSKTELETHNLYIQLKILKSTVYANEQNSDISLIYWLKIIHDVDCHLLQKTVNRLLYTMGGTFSEPIPNVGDVGYVAIVVLQNDKLRLLHCPPNVREMVHNTIR